MACASSEVSVRSRLARSCRMCAGSVVPVSGSIPTACAKRNTTWAGVALVTRGEAGDQRVAQHLAGWR